MQHRGLKLHSFICIHPLVFYEYFGDKSATYKQEYIWYIYFYLYVRLTDNLYTSNWLSLNTLNIDEKRVIVYNREEPLMKLFRSLGMTPIPVDLTDAFVFGGAFHCWTCDIRRKGGLESYFEW